MGKIAGRLTIEELGLDAQRLQQFGKDDAAHAVDAVDNDTEASLAHSLSVDQFE